MCGITGVLDPSRSRGTDELLALVDTMAEQVRRRGPDGCGTWCDADAGIALGHRRLSVVDLSDAGAQPMMSADGRWVITYNGEIYGYEELAKELRAAGCTLRGHSDTEVLLEAIALWGLRQVLDRIDGMFAFGLWDRRERRLTLVRDRLGEKPLYYGTAGSEVVFGSGLDAIRVHPRFDPEIDRDALCALLRYKCVPAPLSIYRDARKLLPGHIVEVDERGFGRPTPYWSVIEAALAGADRPFTGSADDAADELAHLLGAAVRRRMVADVPLGAFLSGGIDSSTVVALMQAQSTEQIRTFTIGSNVADFDESGPARAVAAQLGTAHEEFVVSGADALAAVDRLAGVYDEPFADSSQIPTLLVSELSRSTVTVALTGDGGDELFGGYNRYRWIPSVHGRLRRVPAPVRGRAAKAATMIAPRRWDQLAKAAPARVRPQQFGLKVEKLASVAELSDPAAMYLRVVSHWPDPGTVVLGGHDPELLPSSPSRWPGLGHLASELMAVDLGWYLPDDILAKVDRASMSVGLEGRIPFLDRRVVEFALSLPPSLKAGPRSKDVVRRVLARHVPDEFVDRPKAGFGIPIDDWLRGPLRSWGRDLLATATAGDYFQRDVVTRTWDEHQRSVRNHGYRLWDVLSFVAWAESRLPPHRPADLPIGAPPLPA